jgi:hypothetical protein
MPISHAHKLSYTRHTILELKSAKLTRIIVYLHAPDPNPYSGFQVGLYKRLQLAVVGYNR